MMPAGGASTEVVIVDRYGALPKRATDSQPRPKAWTNTLQLTLDDAEVRLDEITQWLKAHGNMRPDLLRPRRQWQAKLQQAIDAARHGAVYAARAQMQRTHPDKGGDPEAFQKAREALERAQATD
jgi:hypothetical protein